MLFYITFISFIIDRFAKLLISVNLQYGESIQVFPFFNITYIKNTGIAFSLLSGNNDILIWINLAIVIFFIIIIFLSRLQRGLVYIAYGFILGGAFSNLWDRYFYNGVIDYIDLKVWPVFNFADTAITIGAILIAYSTLIDFMSSDEKNQ